MNLSDTLVDISKFDYDSIRFVRPMDFPHLNKNISVYFRKNSSKLKKKIILVTPKMRAPFGITKFTNTTNESFNIALSFATISNIHNEESIKRFYNFINHIDDTVKTTLSEPSVIKIKNKIIFKQTLTKSSKSKYKNNPPLLNLSLPYDPTTGFFFHTYDENAKKSNIDIIEKNSIVSVAIELTNLIFHKNKETDAYRFRCNWTVLQIRKFKPYSPSQELFMNVCFIADEDNPDDVVHKQLHGPAIKSISPPNIYLQSVMEVAETNSAIPPPPPLPGRPAAPPPPPLPKKNDRAYKPSLAEIQMQLTRLKKTPVPVDKPICETTKTIEQNTNPQTKTTNASGYESDSDSESKSPNSKSNIKSHTKSKTDKSDESNDKPTKTKSKTDEPEDKPTKTKTKCKTDEPEDKPTKTRTKSKTEKPTKTKSKTKYDESDDEPDDKPAKTKSKSDDPDDKPTKAKNKTKSDESEDKPVKTKSKTKSDEPEDKPTKAKTKSKSDESEDKSTKSKTKSDDPVKTTKSKVIDTKAKTRGRSPSVSPVRSKTKTSSTKTKAKYTSSDTDSE